MRRANALSAFVVSFSAACPELSHLERIDAGEITDAGVVASDAGDDGGPSDSGIDEVDAGEPPDSGVSEEDGGQACVNTVDRPVACEDDQDFCDDLNDAVVSNVDLVGAWSRLDSSGAFVLDLRFVGVPFASGECADVTVGVLEDQDDANDDTTFGIVLNDVLRARDVDRVSGVTGCNYPPDEFASRDGAAVVEHPLSDVQISNDDHVLRLILRGETPYVSVPRYTLSINHTGDAPFGSDEGAPSAPNLVVSVGGEPDTVAFTPITETACPTE